jgi:ribonuclease T2
MRRIAMAALGAVLAVGPAAAFEPLDGYFIALEACEAFQSKNKLTNPGDVLTEPMRAYAMRAINAAGGDFFQVSVPGAPVTAERWVHVSCGVHVVEAGTPVSGTPSGPVAVAPQAGSESAENVLALSWQPAFCEVRPNKPECVDLNAGNLPVTERQLSVHGLWPQPEANAYCGVPEALVALDRASRWSELPEAATDAETHELLQVAMPGTASHLERHEWIKHGTCHRGAGGADEYFDDTLRIVEAVNASGVAALFADHVGAELETAAIRVAFDTAFGAGAGAGVQVHCTGDGGRTLIQELKIGLAGTIGPDASPGELMLAADPVSPGCPRGVVDPAGLQ